MNRKTTGIILTGVLVLALAYLLVQFRPASVKYDRTQSIGVSTGVGQALAEVTANLIQDRGQVVLVSDHALTADHDDYDNRWNAFRDELKTHVGANIEKIEIVEPQPEMGMPGCPSSAFLRILSNHANAAAIVFITELPEWLTVSDGIPKNVTAKIIAMDTMGNLTRSHYRGYFDSGILSALIGPNFVSIGNSDAIPKTPREWFNKHYQVYTPLNVETLPE